MIWCVDDDSTIRDIEVYTLQSTGFEAEGFADGQSMLAELSSRRPDLIILDIMLPGEDGVEVLKKIRKTPATKNIPVIMATAKGTEMDKIKSLDTGADDYLVKPFGMMEMVSRVKAVLRRCTQELQSVEKEDVITLEGIVLNVSQHIVTVQGERIALTLKEFEILRLFMQSPGKVFSRDALLSKVWGIDYMGETRTVDMHIKTLRQKLGEKGSIIRTVIGVGYRLEVGND